MSWLKHLGTTGFGVRVLSLFILGSAAVGAPAEAGAQETERKVALSLKQCLNMALERHPLLQRARLGAQVGDARLARTRADYGLTFGAEALLRQNLSPASSSFIEGAEILNQTRQQYNVFLDQDVATGGNLRFSLDNNILYSNSTRVDFNPAIAPQLGLQISQPLLRNALNGFRLIQAQEQLRYIAQLDLRREAMDTAFNVQEGYWNLVQFQERLRVLRQSLDILNNLFEMNTEKQKAGFLSKIDVLQTRARLASRQASLLDAQRNLQNNLDQLKQLLNPDDNPLLDWQSLIEPTDQPLYQPQATDVEKSYALALTRRPDYLSALAQLEVLKAREAIAAQNLLPQLNWQGAAGLESLEQNYGSALGQLFNFRTYFWSTGLRFEVPVVGNEFVALHRESVLQRQQQEQQLVFLRQQIRRQIRQAVRNVELVGQQVEATREAKSLAEEQLKAQTEKLNLGLTTNFQVLQFQQDFENASLAEVNVTLAYVQAVNNLKNQEGQLLKAFALEQYLP